MSVDPPATALPVELTQQSPTPIWHNGPTRRHRYAREKIGEETWNGERYAFYSRTATISTESILLVGPSMRRVFLEIQNQGSGDLFLGYGTSAANNGTNSQKLVADAVQSFTDKFVPSNEIFAISSSSSLVCIVEGIPIE